MNSLSLWKCIYNVAFEEVTFEVKRFNRSIPSNRKHVFFALQQVLIFKTSLFHHLLELLHFQACLLGQIGINPYGKQTYGLLHPYAP